ncbi:hypothetical protein [uncultured Polaribacter sp.]|jgi:hypothetical protein|uniref:hypothetical protein n=1 Tax=uncultured Polaribacter sp. TaxID=174711 RepID=UPI002632BB3D|nr:hypothetical protein [uncultured Polaribacter sp.]
MFLGFQILFLILISPFIIGIFLYGVKRKNEFIGKLILTFYKAGIGFLILIILISILSKKKVLEKSDFYGEYTIDRNYFPGKQANWQYNNFRFEIKKNDSIYFHITDGEKINKTYKGNISTFLPSYKSARIKIRMEYPNHHILETNPTIYREAWSFFLVFKSPKFNNMYFRKNEWKRIK